MSRIGIDARLLAYREGGIAEYMRRLLEWLPRIDAHDQFFALRHFKDRAPKSDVRSLHEMRVFTPPHHRFEREALALEVLRARLDLLHSPDFIPPRFGARHHVITIHDLAFLIYPEFQTRDSLTYYTGHIHAATRQAAHILAISQATKNDICERLSVPPDKVTVHPLGVDAAFRPQSDVQVADALAPYALSPGYILFVGTFEPRKNIPTLVTAYEIFRASRPDAPPLVLAGRRGWHDEAIFARVAASPATHHIRWLENPAPNHMPGLYAGAGVLVLPSHYEGFGFPPLEAMACGTPAIVSKRGSLPEVVGEAGLLIDPDQPAMLAQALDIALSDADFRLRSREEGLGRAQQFTWQRTAQIVAAIYQDVLS